MDARIVESALDRLRPGLTPDGFDLRLYEIAGDDVHVVLAARPDACLDCLVPDELMTSMIDDLIRAHDTSLGQVHLVKQGFDA
jgi:Fe-S cluster biogenesis protein NfuA